jgi:excisionase family DNA binding protein
VTQRTIRRWIAQGRITGYRIGARVIRVRADEQ